MKFNPISKSSNYLLLISLFCHFTCIAQTQDTENGRTRSKGSVHKYAIVSGRAFLITKTGDLKPARMADVFLLFDGRDKQDNAEYAALFYEKAVSDGYARKDELAHLSDEAQLCQWQLHNLHKALADTLTWTLSNGRGHQIRSDTADEEGSFRLVNVPPGFYILVVQGRAGLSEAVWEKPLRVMEAGTLLWNGPKLSKPEQACVAIE